MPVELPDTDISNSKDPALITLLDEFFSDHADSLFYFCYRRLGDAHAAQDASSRIVLKAMKSLARFSPDTSNPGVTFRAWIYRIARNDLIDYQRTHKDASSLDRVGHDGQRIHDPVDPHHGPEEQAIAKEADARVHSMLHQLPDSQRAIVELRLAGLSGDEICQTLGMTLSGVKSAQYRAYQRHREILSDETDRGSHTP